MPGACLRGPGRAESIRAELAPAPAPGRSVLGSSPCWSPPGGLGLPASAVPAPTPGRRGPAVRMPWRQVRGRCARRFLGLEGLFSESAQNPSPPHSFPQLASCSPGRRASAQPSREVPQMQTGSGRGGQARCPTAWPGEVGSRPPGPGEHGANQIGGPEPAPAPADLAFPAGSPVWLRCGDRARP